MFSETSFPHMPADSLQLCYQQHRRPTLKGHAAEQPPPPDHPLMLGGPPCRSPVLCAARKKQQLSQNPIKDLDGSTPLPGAGSPTRVQGAWEGREGPICSCCRARSWLRPLRKVPESQCITQLGWEVGKVPLEALQRRARPGLCSKHLH